MLRVKLFCVAQVVILSISADRVLSPEAGNMRWVSSANLIIILLIRKWFYGLRIAKIL